MITRFYAVTRSEKSTSLYLLVAEEGKGLVHAEKLDLRGESLVKPKEWIPKFPRLSIGVDLTLYVPDDVDWERVGMKAHRTATIIALFLDEDTARGCFSLLEIHPDPGNKWIEHTKEVLAEIGADHPLFEILGPPLAAR